MAKVNVIIVGAGPSGLCAAKEAKGEGLVPLVLEKEAGLGGVWRPETGCAWDTMTTNLSKHTCAFSDFPWPSEDAGVLFPRKASVHAYLERYAAQFDLHESIRYRCNVTGLERRDNMWEVRWSDAIGGSEHAQVVPHVVVASGVFAAPNVPVFENVDKTTAKVIHSSGYGDGAVVKGKRVLVVGSSLTALELAAEVASSADSVTHAFRSPTWVLPRALPANLLPPKPDEGPGEMLPVDLAFYTRSFYTRPLVTREQTIKGKNTFMASLCTAQQAVPTLTIPAELFSQPINVAISDRYVSAVSSGVIGVKRNATIERFGVGTDVVEFSNGTAASFDVVILCTGYRMDAHYLDASTRETLAYDDADTLQPLVLYRATVHPRLPGLFFVGMYKGPYFAVLELQAKWAVRVFKGSVSLPGVEDMEAEMKEVDLAIRTTLPRLQFPHPDYVRMADGIASAAGLLELDDLKVRDEDLYARFIAARVVCDGGFSLDDVPGYLDRVAEVVAAAKVSIRDRKYIESDASQ